MSEDEGPWARAQAEHARANPPPPPPPRFGVAHPVRLALWIAGLLVLAAAVYALYRAFPGRGTSKMDIAYAGPWIAMLAMGVALLVRTRFNARRSAIHAAIWVGLISAVALGYAYRAELAGVGQRLVAEFAPGYALPTAPHEVVVTRDQGGAFVIFGKVNAATVRFVVDTGASDVVLSPDDAARAGIDIKSLTYSRPAETANGVGAGAPVKLATLAIGPLKIANAEVTVNQAPMTVSLLGMDFLKRLDSFEIKGDRLYMRWHG